MSDRIAGEDQAQEIVEILAPLGGSAGPEGLVEAADALRGGG